MGFGNNPILYSDFLGDTVVVGNISWIDKALDFVGYETDAMAYKRQVEADLDQLKKDDSEVAKVITELENSPNTHKIEIPEDDGKGNRVTYNTEKLDKGESQGTNIGYDPNNEKSVRGDKRTPRASLAHELQHSYDTDIDITPEKIEVAGVPLREINAVRLENKVRKVTGDKKRTTYGGKKIPSYLLDY
ncbi:hypothetical protein OKW21_005415 [Catalinimonas alkaloidigena]|nr:hypothetical protein [Catalinimonas alkaloidigena]